MSDQYGERGEVELIHPATGERWHLPLLKRPGGDGADVTVSHLGAYPPKQVIGDWTRNDHELLSSFTQSDTSGGGQIRDAAESTDQGRFYYATLDTQYPHQVALLPLMTALPAPAGEGAALLLGDFGATLLAAWDTTLYAVTPAGADPKGTLAAIPVGPLAVYQGTGTTTKAFIPLGGAGYQTWDGATLSAAITAAKPVSLVEWDNKLVSFNIDGTITMTVDQVTWTPVAAVDASHTPRFLVGFYDRQGDPALHAVTNRAVFGVDFVATTVYQTQLAPPPHPDAALAGAVWRTDLYVSYGLGVHRYTGDTISAMGLDRDDGLPQEYRGAITSMTSGYNALYALVHGVAEESDATETFISDLSAHDGVFPPSAVQSAVMLWNGYGWHTLWTSGEEAGVARNLLVSTANDTYRLWWAFGDTLYVRDLPRTFYNPRSRTGTETFAPSGQITYSTLDMDMTGQEKILVSIEARTRDVTDTETVTLEYQIDDGAWDYLGVIDTQPALGTTRFRLGANGTYPDGQDRYDGVTFDRVTVRATLQRGDDATKTPLLESVGVTFQKVMGTLNAYQFSVDCTGIDTYKGRTARERQLFLDQMVSVHALIPFGHLGVWRSVRFAGVAGTDRTGVDFGGNRTVSLLESWDA